MSIVKINAITVPADSGDELAHRFAGRARVVDGQPGFQGFELLRPTDERTTWLVVTRWADEASFETWRSGQNFGAAHGRATSASEGHGAPEGPPSAGSGGTAADHPGPQRPVGMSAELWSFDVAGGSQTP